MNKSIESIILELGELKVFELRERYEALYGEPCFSKHKLFIVKRIVWKLQSQRENLAPDIQAEILTLPEIRQSQGYFTGRKLHPVAQEVDWKKQRIMWKQL